MADRYAVVGHPIAHSRSPEIHMAFARQTRQDLVYDAIMAPVDGFAATVAAFRAAGGRGLNITVPFKLEAYALATALTERAREAGAVNTLRFDGAEALGDNTDGAGLVADITLRLGVPVTGKRVLLMGAGGAARGALGPLLRERPSRLVIANRTPGKAKALAHAFATQGPAQGGGYDEAAGESFDIVVNATSASLDGVVPPLPQGTFARGALAYDMVYGERAKFFAESARAAGASIVADGIGMLVAQAAESFLLWRGVRPDTSPVVEMLGVS